MYKERNVYSNWGYFLMAETGLGKLSNKGLERLWKSAILSFADQLAGVNCKQQIFVTFCFRRVNILLVAMNE